MNRREFLTASGAAALSTTGTFHSMESLVPSDSGAYKAIHKPLDRFVEQYMRGMNAPGMTLTFADRDGVQRVVTYGFTDLETRARVKPDELFEIGSISKSFVALCLRSEEHTSELQSRVDLVCRLLLEKKKKKKKMTCALIH